MKHSFRRLSGQVFPTPTRTAVHAAASLAAAVLLLVGLPAAAVEVELNDGTVIEASSFKVTGSFVMLTLENGSQVAFALEDVNLDSLLVASDETGDEVADEAEQPSTASDVGGRAFGQAIADSGAESAVVVTDRDVAHVRPSELDDEEDGEEEEQAPASGGGSVTMQDYRLEEVSSGTYQVQGTVINRSGDDVIEVRVALTVNGPDGNELSKAELPIAASLAPDQTADFTHTFDGPQGASPQVQTKITWLGRAAPAEDEEAQQ